MRTLSSTMLVGAVAVGALAAESSSVESIIPIIDITALVATDSSTEAKQEVANMIGRACEDVGFFVIQGHGIRWVGVSVGVCAGKGRATPGFARTNRRRREAR